MEMEKGKAAEKVLKQAGYTVSQRCCSRPCCFDFAARKNETLVFIKTQSNIGNVSPSDSCELKAILECTSGAAFLISKNMREKPLEDDTVYSRYDILAVTQRTFEKVILHEAHPLIQAAPGGYYVEIDGEAIKRRRQELHLSIGELAGMMGTSRRTLHGYEQGITKASVSAAYNIICILGIPVAKPINMFKKSKKQPGRFLTTAKHALTRNKLIQKIVQKFAYYNITAFRKAPFDFLINIPEKKIKIIGGVTDKKEKELDRRVDEILSVSEVVQAHPIFITEKQKALNKDIHCVCSKELSEIKNPQDLIASSK